MAEPAALLAEPGTLALFGFGGATPAADDPRYLQVALDSFDAPTPLELWQIDAPIDCGSDGALRWSAGGGWLFVAVELDEREHGGPAATAQLAYEQLRRFVATRSEQHVLRVWNYLGAINQGEGDAERYKHFCDGRAAGMGDFFAGGSPPPPRSATCAARICCRSTCSPATSPVSAWRTRARSAPGAIRASTAAPRPASPAR
jgi:chorismate lyase/3-hydroxybenzoate synthase